MDGAVCPECKGPACNIAIDYGAGDVVCRGCGLVIKHRVVDDSSEWRTFSNDGSRRDSTDPSRVGTAMHELLGAGRLATEIGAPRRSSGAAGAGRGAPAGSGAGAGGRGGGRASGSRPGGVSRNSLESLSRLHAQQMVSTHDKKLLASFSRVRRLCGLMTLPDRVADRAEALVVRADKFRLIRGRPQPVVVAALVYAACRLESLTRTLREVSSAAGTRVRDVGRFFLMLKRVLKLEVRTVAAADLLARLCDQLRLHMRVRFCAEYLAKLVHDKGVCTGRSPVTVAAACVWIATQLADASCEIKEVSAAAGIVESSVRAAYNDIFPHIGVLLSAVRSNSELDPRIRARCQSERIPDLRVRSRAPVTLPQEAAKPHRAPVNGEDAAGLEQGEFRSSVAETRPLGGGKAVTERLHSDDRSDAAVTYLPSPADPAADTEISGDDTASDAGSASVGRAGGTSPFPHHGESIAASNGAPAHGASGGDSGDGSVVSTTSDSSNHAGGGDSTASLLSVATTHSLTESVASQVSASQATLPKPVPELVQGGIFGSLRTARPAAQPATRDEPRAVKRGRDGGSGGDPTPSSQRLRL